MTQLVREHGKIILMILVSLCILAILFAVYFPFWKSSEVNQDQKVAEGSFYTSIAACPALSVPACINANQGEEIDLLQGVSAEDVEDGNLNFAIRVRFANASETWSGTDGKFIYKPNFTGRKYLEYSVKNSKGFCTRKKVLFLVNQKGG